MLACAIQGTDAALAILDLMSNKHYVHGSLTGAAHLSSEMPVFACLPGRLAFLRLGMASTAVVIHHVW